ncbi:hypothetical protein [Streptomyces noursei]|uniref:hypothetical protein n=1 Tax=Streptomyces noursei TaxID=1971 RepID=UPI000F57BE7C|nr:hypothetical protein [Streptomyces noursei]UWS76042.1 hypothetical protein N1H47_35275 [Streptomyces noursei]
MTELKLPLRVGGAQFDLNLDPTVAWQCLPLPHDVQSPKGPVHDLEKRLLALARARVSNELRLQTSFRGDLGIADLAVGNEALSRALSEAEIAQVAEHAAVFPPAARDGDGRWQDVLDDWAEHDGAAPETVTVARALNVLLGDVSRTGVPSRPTVQRRPTR